MGTCYFFIFCVCLFTNGHESVLSSEIQCCNDTFFLPFAAAAGSNKSASSSTTLNTRKLDEETENLSREYFSITFAQHGWIRFFFFIPCFIYRRIRCFHIRGAWKQSMTRNLYRLNYLWELYCFIFIFFVVFSSFITFLSIGCFI